MNLHLVYAGDPTNTLSHAPFTITRNLYDHLKPKFERVIYYDWCHGGPLEPVRSGDVILAHPNYPPSSPCRRLFDLADQAGGCLKCLIFPLHTAMAEINLPFDDLVGRADLVLSITGPYWYDTMEGSPFAHWKPKIVRVDMAVDVASFPFVRADLTPRFNPPGQRAFAYVGCDRPEKGPDLLYEIMRRSPSALHVYGRLDGGIPLLSLPNVHYHGWAETVGPWARDLCRLTDCFLNASRSDANPTTLLEAAAWGLPAACSLGSGYYSDERCHNMFFGLNTADPDGCALLLQHVNTMDEAVLWERALRARAAVESRYTWQAFRTTVWSALSGRLPQR